jgi:Spy/CpxP family protein refolding chaperone
MRKRLLALGVVVIIVVSAAGFAFADAWGWGRGMGRLDRAEDVPARIEAVRALELTDEQVDSIQTILQQTETQTKQLRDQMWQLQTELRSLYWQKDPDQAAIEAKIQAINTLRQQTMQSESTQEQIEGVLTEEQLASWSAANANMRALRGRHPRGGMRGTPGEGEGERVAPTG